MNRPILIVGGAPILKLDAIRYITVKATGATAISLYNEIFNTSGIQSTILLSANCNTENLSTDPKIAHTIIKYESRSELETELKKYIEKNPNSVIVMSAAINDYRISSVEVINHNGYNSINTNNRDAKIPSGSNEIIVKMTPDSKLIDKLKDFGHTGKLVGFKFEDKNTVIESAKQLLRRTNSDLVVANSLCSKIQTLVKADSVVNFTSRHDLLKSLASKILILANL